MGVSMRSVAVASVARVMMMTMTSGASGTSGVRRRQECHHTDEQHHSADEYCKRLAHGSSTVTNAP
jgi:hypothetical protein